MLSSMESEQKIPIIDLASRESVSDDLLQACASWGFFYVKGHDIPAESINECFTIVQDFFSQPESVKNEVPYVPTKNAGYKPAGTYSSANKGAGGQKSDPRESYSMNKWISEEVAASVPLSPGLAENRDKLRIFQGQCWALGTRVLEHMAEALGLSSTYFAAQHHRSMANFDNFEIMHYPKPQMGEVFGHRISPHTDWGSITLLFQQKIGGLQVRPPSYTSPTLSLDEEWTDAPVYDDMILVNVGMVDR